MSEEFEEAMKKDKPTVGDRIINRLEAFATSLEKDNILPMPKEGPPKVELTDTQKRVVLNYMLSVGKGPIEDSDFWGDMPQEEIDQKIDGYCAAINDMEEEVRRLVMSHYGFA